MKHLFVTALPPEGSLILDLAQSHHLLRVLRLERQGMLALTDEAGIQGTGRLVEVREGRAEVEVLERRAETAPLERIVILGLPKGPLLEEALVLGTEAGATEFRLVQARYSQPATLRTDRLEKILRASAGQCRRGHLPQLVGPLPLARALEVLPEVRWIGVQGAPSRPGTEAPAALAVGPEGGWSPEEVALFLDHGFHPVGLGPYILRNPTAVAVGLGRLGPS